MREIGHPGKALALGAVLAAVMLSLAAVEPARAAFTGSNGKIAFFSNRDAGNTEIYTMNADGSSQTRLTNDPGADEQPAFSSDGAKIAFASTRQTPDGTIDREIWVMNADGTNQTQLTNNAFTDTEPTFSPDATKIAFTSNSPAS
jgi:Tol biopolymer transport system component